VDLHHASESAESPRIAHPHQTRQLERLTPPHREPPEGVVAALDSDATEGLSGAEARRRREQYGVTPVERLAIGSVGEGDLDLDEDVSRARFGTINVLEPRVPGPVEDERLHGVKTTLSARRLR